MTIEEKIEELRNLAEKVTGYRYRDITVEIYSNVSPKEYIIKINAHQYADSTDTLEKALQYTKEVLVKKIPKYYYTVTVFDDNSWSFNINNTKESKKIILNNLLGSEKEFLIKLIEDANNAK